MATITQTARAFAARKSAACHNATSDGTTYRLHGHAGGFRCGSRNA